MHFRYRPVLFICYKDDAVISTDEVSWKVRQLDVMSFLCNGLKAMTIDLCHKESAQPYRQGN
jgi:hypothetical protein